MAATSPDQSFTREELALVSRNRGMPLEALREDVTPSGLHYLLIHWDIPEVAAEGWRLEVGGLVARPRSFTLDELRALGERTLRVTMECAGNGRSLLEPRPRNMPWGLEAIGTAEWTGVPLPDVLALVEPADVAVELVFSGADRGVQGGVEHLYQRSLERAEAARPDVLLAWAMNGRPLEPQHGAPLRLLVPGWYGMTSVKWLTGIEAVREPFGGYQQARSYRIRQQPEEVGEPVTRMRVRALMVPPGVPDFPDRKRFQSTGPVEVRGRAWSGRGPIARVEVADNEEWRDATLDPAAGEHAWRGWRFTWEATPGEHVLSCRATAADGETQPLVPDWNLGGYCNNAVQRVAVTVR